MKFAIAFVIGDTKLHDALCCRNGGRTNNTPSICCHCVCPTEFLTTPLLQPFCLWVYDNFPAKTYDNSKQSENYWKSISHHPVINVFHDLDFGDNHHGIHFGTPGETLHMHMLGCAKRAVKCIEYFVKSYSIHCKILHNQISQVAKDYGSRMA